MLTVTRLDALIDEIGRRSVPFQLWGFWDIPGELDEELLLRTVELLVFRAPVLGCRLKRGLWRDHWAPIDDLDIHSCVHVEHVASEVAALRAIDAIVDTILDIERGTGFAVHCFSYGSACRLVLHVHHLFVDGRGMANLMTELARLYCALVQDPSYRPDEPLDDRRGLWQIVRHLSFRNWLLMGINVLLEQILKSFVGRRGLEPFSMDKSSAVTGELGVARHLAIELEPGTLSRIRNWCATRKATVNDFLMTAIIVAIHRWNRRGGPPTAKYLPLVFAADMRRRYAAEAGPVANLSSAHRFWLRQSEIGSFEETARRVKMKMDQMKQLGLSTDGIAMILSGSWIPGFIARTLFRPVFSVIAKTMLAVSGLTNIGVLSADAGCFGADHTASRCSILVPIFPVQNLLFGATTYRGRITLQMGYDGRGLSNAAARDFKEHLLATVKEGLETYR